MTRLSFCVGFAALSLLHLHGPPNCRSRSSRAWRIAADGQRRTYAPWSIAIRATNQLVGLDIRSRTSREAAGREDRLERNAGSRTLPSLQTQARRFHHSGNFGPHLTARVADFVRLSDDRTAFSSCRRTRRKSPTIDLCGKKVGTRAAPASRSRSRKWSKQNCEANGKPAVQYVPGEKQHRRPHQLQAGPASGRGAGQRDVLPYRPSTGDGEIPASSESRSPPAIKGIMFRKDDAALREVVTQHPPRIAGTAPTRPFPQIRAGSNAWPQPMMNAGTQ